LHGDGQVEPDLGTHPRIGLGRGLVADDGQHRIDRDHPANEEGDAGEPEEGERDGKQAARRPVGQTLGQTPGTMPAAGTGGSAGRRSL